LIFMLTLLISACDLPASPASHATQPFDVAATQAAFAVQTEMGRPTWTLTPSRTPAFPATQTPVPPSVNALEATNATPPADATATISPIRVTALPGLVLYTHPDIPDYVFQIDPKRWEKDPSGKTWDLVHQTIANCRIDSVPAHGLGAPKRLFWQDFGRFRWEILDYGAYAYVSSVLGGDPVSQGSSFLELQGYNQAACRSAQEEILTNLMTRREATGEVGFTLFLSPTPRPALDGFSCPNTPPARLRVGDQVSVVTDGLWLRSAPRAEKSTELRQYLRYAPVMIRVISGPACEKYVYWQVEVSTFGEGAETIQGWLAEGDLNEYYLMPVK
jgi:hypothetical protein